MSAPYVLTWNGGLPACALAASLNSHSAPVGSLHSYGSLQLTSLMRSLPTMLHDCTQGPGRQRLSHHIGDCPQQQAAAMDHIGM